MEPEKKTEFFEKVYLPLHVGDDGNLDKCLKT